MCAMLDRTAQRYVSKKRLIFDTFSRGVDDAYIMDLDPLRFPIWEDGKMWDDKRKQWIDDYKPTWTDRIADILAVIFLLACLAVATKPLWAAEEPTLYKYAVGFKCHTGHQPFGITTNDPTLIVGAVLVYVGQIDPNQFLDLAESEEVRAVALNWLKACIGVEPDVES